MKKTVIILGSVVIAMTLVLAGMLFIPILIMQSRLGIADKTDNINVMLTRPNKWKKIAKNPILPEDEMSIIDGSTATIPITAELFRQFYGYTDKQVEKSPVVLHTTTHSAYLNLIHHLHNTYGGIISLIFVTSPSDEEIEYAKNKNIELDLTPIAKDGFVFITHKNNPVDSLTIEQIQDIYTGKITNWKELGGKNLDIKAYQREKNSGSQTAMEQMVMQGKKMLSPRNVLTDDYMYETMGGLIDAVAEYENGPASIGIHIITISTIYTKTKTSTPFCLREV